MIPGIDENAIFVGETRTEARWLVEHVVRAGGRAFPRQPVMLSVGPGQDGWESHLLRGRQGATLVAGTRVQVPMWLWDMGVVSRVYEPYGDGLAEVPRPLNARNHPMRPDVPVEKPKRKYGSEAVDEITRLIDEALETGRSPDYKPINTYVETKQCVDNDGNVRVSDERYDMDTELMAPVQGPPVPDAIQPLVTTSGSWEYPPTRLETDRQFYRRMMLLEEEFSVDTNALDELIARTAIPSTWIRYVTTPENNRLTLEGFRSALRRVQEGDGFLHFSAET